MDGLLKEAGARWDDSARPSQADVGGDSLHAACRSQFIPRALDLKRHPLSAAFPDMTAEEFALLVDDISACVSSLVGIAAPDHIGGTWGATVVRSLIEG